MCRNDPTNDPTGTGLVYQKPRSDPRFTWVRQIRSLGVTLLRLGSTNFAVTSTDVELDSAGVGLVRGIRRCGRARWVGQPTLGCGRLHLQVEFDQCLVSCGRLSVMLEHFPVGLVVFDSKRRVEFWPTCSSDEEGAVKPVTKANGAVAPCYGQIRPRRARFVTQFDVPGTA